MRLFAGRKSGCRNPLSTFDPGTQFRYYASILTKQYIFMGKMKAWYKRNQNTVWSVIGIVVVIIIILAAALCSPKDKGVTITEAPNQTALETSNAIPSYTPAVVIPVSVAPKLSYTDAVRVYGDHRIQFGDTCEATPANSVFKSESNIMIDNRASTAKVFNINNTAYTIGAYDYLVVPFASINAPIQVLIDCGTMQNVATVTIQK